MGGQPAFPLANFGQVAVERCCELSSRSLVLGEENNQTKNSKSQKTSTHTDTQSHIHTRYFVSKKILLKTSMVGAQKIKKTNGAITSVTPPLFGAESPPQTSPARPQGRLLHRQQLRPAVRPPALPPAPQPVLHDGACGTVPRNHVSPGVDA